MPSTGSSHTVAAVSFLNARPLIDGLGDQLDIEMVTAVPSRLLALLLADSADLALCPVIDYQTSPQELCVVPVGGIGSDGPTHTVRVFSRTPLDEVECIHTDGDSRTSVALLQVVLAARYGRVPEIRPLAGWSSRGDVRPDAILLIGDKVVHVDERAERYPCQLDLGAAWKELTGLPFVFATWLARRGCDLGELPAALVRCRERNRLRIPEIVAGQANGWPRELATRYLQSVLRYEIGPRELESMELFWSRCRNLGLLEELRPLRVYDSNCL